MVGGIRPPQKIAPKNETRGWVARTGKVMDKVSVVFFLGTTEFCFFFGPSWTHLLGLPEYNNTPLFITLYPEVHSCGPLYKPICTSSVRES